MMMRYPLDHSFRSILALFYVLSIVLSIVFPLVDGGKFSNLAKSCSNTTYFDSSSLSCLTCFYSNNQQQTTRVPSPSLSNSLFHSPTRCVCRTGYYNRMVNGEDECGKVWPIPCSESICTLCPNQTVPSMDQSRCMKCGDTTLGIQSNGDCSCPSQHRLVETDQNGAYMSEKICLPCLNNTWIMKESGNYTCTSCPHPAMTYTQSQGCQCNSDYMDAGDRDYGETTCIPTPNAKRINVQFPSSLAIQTSFHDIPGIFNHYYMMVASQCFHYESEKDDWTCQTLGNLCVLSHYSPSSVACLLFEYIRKGYRTEITHQVSSWSKTLPMLSYDGTAESISKSTDVQMNVALKPPTSSQTKTTSKLAFQLATYTLNGSLIGFTNLTTQLMYCRDPTDGYTTQWLNMGYGYTETYTCDLSQLVQSSETLFYELFLVDIANGQDIFPLPIRNQNYRDASGTYLNRNGGLGTQDSGFFTRRFFLFDTVSGKTSPNSLPEIIRYANYIHLQVSTQKYDKSLIYPPILTLEYKEIYVEYVSDTAAFWTTATALFSATSVICGFTTILRYYNWQRRNARENQSVSEWEAVLKLGTIYLLLPPSSSTWTFSSLLHVCFFFQLFSILEKIYHQSKVEIFFVDWEKSRAKLIDEDAIQTADAPVSIWRTIFVANEWNEMQTIRLTWIEFTLFWILFLLVGCNLQYLATPQPDPYDLSSGKPQVYLRFANTTFWWLLISCVQRFWKWLIQDRFFTESKTHQFIDMCTMAKISCFVFDEKFHGYYLHCRSPYPYADGSMMELTDQLKQEEAGLVSGRGLEGVAEEIQTFQLFVTEAWKKKYNKIYASLCQAPISTFGRPEIKSTISHQANKKRKTPPNKLLQAHRKLNQFLQKFIENNNDGFRWRIVSETNCINKILGIPPELNSKKLSSLVLDPHETFSKVLFLGIENDLMLLNILTMGICEYKFENTVTACLLTFLLEKGIVLVRNYFGCKNVSQKTLVDDRFLI